jgi:hypothetical protein
MLTVHAVSVPSINRVLVPLEMASTTITVIKIFAGEWCEVIEVATAWRRRRDDHRPPNIWATASKYPTLGSNIDDPMPRDEGAQGEI